MKKNEYLYINKYIIYLYINKYIIYVSYMLHEKIYKLYYTDMKIYFDEK